MGQNSVRISTSMGDIVIELEPAKATATVSNFVRYIEDGFYDGTIFHRVIDGFMIQGGGLGADMRRRPTRGPIRNEADNGLSNTLGSVAMARTDDPHSATAQFFINVADNTFLDHREPSANGWGYCVFGRVVEGMDTVNAIKSVPTSSVGSMKDVPVEPIEIIQAVVEPG